MASNMRGPAGRPPTGLQSKPFFLSASPHPTGGFVYSVAGLSFAGIRTSLSGIAMQIQDQQLSWYPGPQHQIGTAEASSLAARETSRFSSVPA